MIARCLCIPVTLQSPKDMNHCCLVPIAFGMLLVNIYPDIIMQHRKMVSNGVGGLFHYFYIVR